MTEGLRALLDEALELELRLARQQAEEEGEGPPRGGGGGCACGSRVRCWAAVRRSVQQHDPHVLASCHVMQVAWDSAQTMGIALCFRVCSPWLL